MKTQKPKNLLTRVLPDAAWLAVLTLVAGVFTGCGKQEYQVARSTASQESPGNIVIQPQVDILLAEDDTGSMSEVYSPIAAQMPTLLAGLEAKGWNYHFAVTPLTTLRGINEVLASKHDGNWYNIGGWIPATPTSTPSFDPLNFYVTPSFFRTPDQFTQFLTRDDIRNDLNGREPGLQNIYNTLTGAGPSGFLRPGATLVVLVVGNGDDTSGINYCTRSDGVSVPCSDNSQTTSLAGYVQSFKNLKPSASMVKFYAAVSANRTYTSCMGAPAYAGTRYKSVAASLGGASYDICTQGVTNALDQVASSLQTYKLQMRTHYLFIADDPNVASIKVTRYIGGDANNAVEIPQDPVNGWTYVGYQNNVFAIDSPVPMNKTSGYAIELNGSAELMGDDTADVSYTPAGAVNSH